jgi:hypothetical protein
MTNEPTIKDIHKTKGRWWDYQSNSDFPIPTIKDDLAYYFYCEERPNQSCSPQVAFMHNCKKFDHPQMMKYYIKADRWIKLNKILNKINGTFLRN